ncbi:MAG: DUF3152 domain-containing protein [Actinomycetota bacterium]
MTFRRRTLLVVAVLLAACGTPAPDSAIESVTRSTTTTTPAPAATSSTSAAGIEATTAGGSSGGSSPTLVVTDGDAAATTESSAAPANSAPANSASTSTDATVTSTSGGTTATTAAVEPITMRLHLDRRVDDEATAGFAALVESVLTDPRGWEQAGFVFTFADTATDAAYTVVLAEGDEVDELCLPYDTFGRFSCQIGPVVALNADRWRTAVESWPASLDEYRTMLVNHEVGHLIGQHHPAVRFPGDGQPAPVMAQQSSGVAPCLANPWPRPWEIACARTRLEPLAPPYERDIELTCGPDGPIG